MCRAEIYQESAGFGSPGTKPQLPQTIFDTPSVDREGTSPTHRVQAHKSRNSGSDGHSLFECPPVSETTPQRRPSEHRVPEAEACEPRRNVRQRQPVEGQLSEHDDRYNGDLRAQAVHSVSLAAPQSIGHAEHQEVKPGKDANRRNQQRDRECNSNGRRHREGRDQKPDQTQHPSDAVIDDQKKSPTLYKPRYRGPDRGGRRACIRPQRSLSRLWGSGEDSRPRLVPRLRGKTPVKIRKGDLVGGNGGRR